MLRDDPEVKKIKIKFAFPNKYLSKILLTHIGMKNVGRNNKAFIIDYDEILREEYEKMNLNATPEPKRMRLCELH